MHRGSSADAGDCCNSDTCPERHAPRRRCRRRADRLPHIWPTATAARQRRCRARSPGRPCQNPPAEPVHHGRQIDEAAGPGDVGDVHCPNLVRPLRHQVAQQIRVDLGRTDPPASGIRISLCSPAAASPMPRGIPGGRGGRRHRDARIGNPTPAVADEHSAGGENPE